MNNYICSNCGDYFQRYQSQVKNKNNIFCSKRCADLFATGKRRCSRTEFKKGQKPHNYKGGTYTISRAGGKKYILIHMPDNPMADSKGYVREHRLVASKKIGRILEKNEIVHHIDGNTLNNDPDNLEVMNKKDHDRMNTPLNVHRRWYENKVK